MARCKVVRDVKLEPPKQGPVVGVVQHAHGQARGRHAVEEHRAGEQINAVDVLASAHARGRARKVARVPAVVRNPRHGGGRRGVEGLRAVSVPR